MINELSSLSDSYYKIHLEEIPTAHICQVSVKVIITEY